MGNKEHIEKDFNMIESVLNNFGFDEPGVAKKLSETHPTLQQTFMRLCAEYIYIQSEKSSFDGRNEATVQACKLLRPVLEEHHLHFPLI